MGGAMNVSLLSLPPAETRAGFDQVAASGGAVLGDDGAGTAGTRPSADEVTRFHAFLTAAGPGLTAARAGHGQPPVHRTSREMRGQVWTTPHSPSPF